MRLHLLESHLRARRAWLALPTVSSAVAHLAAVGVLVGAAPDGTSPDDATSREAVFLLPLIPQVPVEPPAPLVQLRWSGMGDGLLPGLGGDATAGVGQPRARAGGGTLQPAALPAPDVQPVDGSFVYREEQLDQPVERDPASAGPVYPEPLRLTNTEGLVVAEWVVDTTGRADLESLRVLESTHPLFTAAVRECVPGMYFRPAELAGRKVRQLVRQEFRFQLQLPVVARTDSSASH
jgi:protein TonB